MELIQALALVAVVFCINSSSEVDPALPGRREEGPSEPETAEKKG